MIDLYNVWKDETPDEDWNRFIRFCESKKMTNQLMSALLLKHNMCGTFDYWWKDPNPSAEGEWFWSLFLDRANRYES